MTIALHSEGKSSLNTWLVLVDKGRKGFRTDRTSCCALVHRVSRGRLDHIAQLAHSFHDLPVATDMSDVAPGTGTVTDTNTPLESERQT